MQRWSQLATRNWRARPVRTLGSILAIALGTGAVVWVTCCYESVRQTVTRWSDNFVGNSDITVDSVAGKHHVFEQSVADELRALPDVAHLTVRLVQRLRGVAVKRSEAVGDGALLPMPQSTPELDFHGIDLASEFRFRSYTLTDGRMVAPEDRLACVLDEEYAYEARVGAGDVLRVWATDWDRPREIEIVGVMERRRITRFQKGFALMSLTALQSIAGKDDLINSIDIILKDDAKPSLAAARARIFAVVQRSEPAVNVSSAEARTRQIEKAQGQLEFVLALLSCVSMLTALFIILSTLSMGLVERIKQLGLLRCVGLTRGQLGWLMLVEVMPLGAFGVAAGIPIGLGLTLLTRWTAPTYVGSFVISWHGIALAAGAGLVTTLLAAIVPALGSAGVSPLEATRPRARATRTWPLVAFGLLGGAALLVQSGLVYELRRSPTFVKAATTAVVLLYAGYALLGPALIRLVGAPVAALAAALLRVRGRLMHDQIGHAVWRSAGICCGIMVGLSLIVGLVVFSVSVRAGWQFPAQFPEAYVWSFAQLREDADGVVAQIPGVAAHTSANAVNAIVDEKPATIMAQVLHSVTWFLGCEPDTFFQLVRLEFLEGDEQEAIALLRKGGHIIIAKDFAITRNKRLGDTVRVVIGNRQRLFTVAGVIDSPALDVAANYFQAQSETHVAAVGSVLGTNADLKAMFGVEGRKLVLLNFAPTPPVPPDWPPPRDSAEGVRLPAFAFDERAPIDQRWRRWQEERVLAEIRQRLDAPAAFSGTVRELKEQIDAEITGMTRLLTAVPTVALLVAAIGVANLMTANVYSRARQLAILRAVGATRGLLLRMVVAEALVLGLLGSGMGWLLGMHLAFNTSSMTRTMWGLDAPVLVPWSYVGAAVGLTLGLSILAGIVPARHAARTDVVSAMRAL